MERSDYLYPNVAPVALARLQGLEAVEDPGTFAALEALGDVTGRRCLEVGAGAGSVARWLASRIGPAGHLVVTDLEPQLLQALASPTVEVWRHDLSCDPLPIGAFDLIHVRHVLFHLGRQVEHALDTLCAALAPGGALLVEESDFEGAGALPEAPGAPREAYDAGLAAMLALYQKRGLDVRLGSTLAEALERRGLHVRAIARDHRVVRGGEPEAHFHRDSVAQIAPAIEAAGLASSSVIRSMRDALVDPHLIYRTRQTVRVTAALAN